MTESKLASTDRPMRVYESGLALLDTEIRTEVTLIYGRARQVGDGRAQDVVNTLPIGTND